MSGARPGTDAPRGAPGGDDPLGTLLAELRRREPEATERLLDVAQELVGLARTFLDVVAQVLDEQREALQDDAAAGSSARVQRIAVDTDDTGGAAETGA